jgi:DeoR/GlpR family transcriptional regulator of sugar metabolism
LLDKPTARTSELALKYRVSIDTIERAIRELGEEKRAKPFHGGIARLSTSDLTYAAFADKVQPVKPSVVETIAQLVEKDQAIILDWGPIALPLARYIPTDLRSTVITNSPAIALAFAEHQHIEVRMIGGQLREGALVPIEDEEIKFLKTLRVGLCVLGSCYVDLKGMTSPNREEAKLKEAMTANASKVIVVVSNENLDNAAKFIIGPLDRITHIVADSNVSAKKLKPYENRRIKIVEG